MHSGTTIKNYLQQDWQPVSQEARRAVSPNDPWLPTYSIKVENENPYYETLVDAVMAIEEMKTHDSVKRTYFIERVREGAVFTICMANPNYQEEGVLAAIASTVHFCFQSAIG